MVLCKIDLFDVSVSLFHMDEHWLVIVHPNVVHMSIVHSSTLYSSSCRIGICIMSHRVLICAKDVKMSF